MNENQRQPTRPLALRLVGLGLRTLHRVAPDQAARAATALMLTPQRRPKRRPPSMPDPKTVETDRGTAVVRRIGDGPPVLLVHGWGGHAGQFKDWPARLNEAGLGALLVDLPAHGDAPGKRTNVAAAATVVGAVAAAEAPLAGVVAHSFGGLATLYAMSLGLLSVPSAVLIGTATVPQQLTRLFGSLLDLPPDMIQRIKARTEVVAGVPMERVDPVGYAQGLKTSALLIHDTADARISIDESRRLAAAWPGVRTHWTTGLGHTRILADPAVIGEAVDFLTRHGRTTGPGTIPPRLAGAGDCITSIQGTNVKIR
ncbi:MAG: alpha/beta fold hydrolase [Ectothiorhodospiraceae bacterium]|nr:alpha/beta fold hydrolase [Ectothiorhodospiraceae bacterium]